MRISDWSSDVCSSDLLEDAGEASSETALPRTRTTDRLQLRLMREDIVQLDAAANARGLKRTEWLVMLLRRRLHATSPPPRGDRVLIAQSWRELNRIGINLNQAVHALHAARSEEHPSALPSLMRTSSA